MPYKKRSRSQYDRNRKNVAVATMNTKNWGKISYLKGTKPVVVEIRTNGVKQLAITGIKDYSEILNVKKDLEEATKQDLERHQKARFTVNFPKTRRKPVKFSVAGEQPITPPIIHHPAWPPADNLVEEIKEEMRKNPNRKTASNLEAMTYLNTASSAAPMSEQWNRIYFYLTRKHLKRKGWQRFDSSMGFLNQHKTLSEYDQRELNHLKDWIFKQQQKVLRERKKQAKKLEREKE